MKEVLREKARKWKRVLGRSVEIFFKIDGEQRGAAFSFYALFALFPLVLLFVTVGSYFVDRDRAVEEVIAFLDQYAPLSEDQQLSVFALIEGVIEARGGVGMIALLGLLWSSMRFFYVLVRAVNKAWNTEEYSWWRLPLQNLVMLGILATALLLGALAPALALGLKEWLPDHFLGVSALYGWFVLLVPVLLLFYGFSMLYKLAPRRPTRFGEVWLAALLVALLLRGCQQLFVWYVTHFGGFNALYGTLGGVVALMLWIYLSGSIIILGACICAAQVDVLGGGKGRHPGAPPRRTGDAG